MDEKTIYEIMQQAPVDKTYDDVKREYYKAFRNVPNTLAKLWNIESDEKKVQKTGENADKWDEIRDICDEFDRAATMSLEEALRRSREEQSKADLKTIKESESDN